MLFLTHIHYGSHFMYLSYMCFDNCIMSCLHHYRITYNSLTGLKKICGTCWYFNVSIVLLLPECHIIKTMQYVTISNWLLSLRNMHLNFPHKTQVFKSNGYKSRRVGAGSSGGPMFRFVRKWQTVLQSGCTVLYLHQQWTRNPAVVQPPQHLVWPVLFYFHSFFSFNSVG